MYIHEDSSRFPKRKNPRMTHFDYTSANYYFITVCTHNRECLFGTSGQLNVLGQLVQKGIENIPLHFPGVKMDKYVVMPNHVHAIVVIEEGCAASLSTIIGQYKSAVSKYVSASRLWQRSFHDHVIRNRISYEKIWNYIDTNPVRWKSDCFYAE